MVVHTNILSGGCFLAIWGRDILGSCDSSDLNDPHAQLNSQPWFPVLVPLAMDHCPLATNFHHLVKIFLLLESFLLFIATRYDFLHVATQNLFVNLISESTASIRTKYVTTKISLYVARA